MEVIVREELTLFDKRRWEDFYPTGFLESQSYDRSSLVKILTRYNKSIGNDVKALKQIQRLGDESTFCVVTGQQAGLLGGPIYTFLKAISCLQMASEIGAVPVFWAATEDHDVSEVSVTYDFDDHGNLKKLSLPLSPSRHLAVEDIILTDFHRNRLSQFCQELQIEMPNSTNFGQAMVQVLLQAFQGTGLVLLEPKILRPLGRSFFVKEIMNRQEIASVLQATTKKLILAGGTPAMDVSEGSVLFLKSKEGRREKVSLDMPKEELLRVLDEERDRLSTGAAARAVFQSVVLPTRAYVAGPGEMAYFRQLGDYHAFHGTAMPRLQPRMSATFIPPQAVRFLQAVDLNPWDEIPLEGLESQGAASHYLRNVLHPRSKPQERVFCWWSMQRRSSEWLVGEVLSKCSYKNKGHHFCKFQCSSSK